MLPWKCQPPTLAKTAAVRQCRRTLASAGPGNEIALWDISSGKQRAKFAGHQDKVSAVSFSPDGKTLASGGFDDTVRLWDAVTGKEKAVWKGHAGAVKLVAFSADGKLLVSAHTWPRPGAVRVWDVALGKPILVLAGKGDKDKGMTCTAFSPDGRTIATAEAVGRDRHTLTLWDAVTGRETGSLKGQVAEVTALLFSPDGKTLFSGGGIYAPSGEVKCWDVARRRLRYPLQGHFSLVTTLVFSSDGNTLISGSEDQTVKLWSVATGKEKAILTGKAVCSLALSADGKRVVAGGGGLLGFTTEEVRGWDTATGKERSFKTKEELYTAATLSPDGKTVAAGCLYQTIKFWDVATGKLQGTLPLGSGPRWVTTLAYSPDGKTLLAGVGWLGSGEAVLCDVAARKVKARLPYTKVTAAAFSADGKTLASGGLDKTIKLWDVAVLLKSSR